MYSVTVPVILEISGYYTLEEETKFIGQVLVVNPTSSSAFQDCPQTLNLMVLMNLLICTMFSLEPQSFFSLWSKLCPRFLVQGAGLQNMLRGL